MNTSTIESRWARLGILFNAELCPESPDIERLILDTARELPKNPRLFPLVITWLVEHGFFVARHRLKRLITSELEPEHQSTLGLLLHEAISRGAPPELRIARDVCQLCESPRPLFENYQHHALAPIAESNASDVSTIWGLWAPSTTLKYDAIRPSKWILVNNPSAFNRVVRRGDLRVSILESLRLDFDGVACSLSAIGRATGATRVAVRAAVESLIQEGAVIEDHRHHGKREREIELLVA